MGSHGVSGEGATTQGQWTRTRGGRHVQTSYYLWGPYIRNRFMGALYSIFVVGGGNNSVANIYVSIHTSCRILLTHRALHFQLLFKPTKRVPHRREDR